MAVDVPLHADKKAELTSTMINNMNIFGFTDTFKRFTSNNNFVLGLYGRQHGWMSAIRRVRL